MKFVRWQLITRLMVFISYCMQMLKHYIVYLNLISYCISIITLQNKNRDRKWKEKEYQIFLLLELERGRGELRLRYTQARIQNNLPLAIILCRDFVKYICVYICICVYIYIYVCVYIFIVLFFFLKAIQRHQRFLAKE